MTWLEQQVRNASLRQLGACALIIAGVVGLLGYNQRYLANYFSGIYEMPRAEVLSTRSHEELPRYWVRLTPDQIFDTGIDIITVNKKRGVETGRRVTGHYFVAQIGEKLLLIKSDSQAKPSGATIDGWLTAQNEWYMERLAADPARSKFGPLFLPITLDTGDFVSSANLILYASAAATGAAVLWALWAVFRAARPAGHSALKRLAAMPGETLADASRSISADIRARRTAKMRDGVQLTSGHLVQTSALTFNVRPLADLLWTYPIITTKKLYGFIPTGKTHSAAFYFGNGQITLKGSEPQTMAAMQHVSYVAPWTLIGHSADIEQAYKKQRQNLIGFVMGRREQSLAAAQAQQASGSRSSA